MDVRLAHFHRLLGPCQLAREYSLLPKRAFFAKAQGVVLDGKALQKAIESGRDSAQEEAFGRLRLEPDPEHPPVRGVIVQPGHDPSSRGVTGAQERPPVRRQTRSLDFDSYRGARDFILHDVLNVPRNVKSVLSRIEVYLGLRPKSTLRLKAEPSPNAKTHRKAKKNIPRPPRRPVLRGDQSPPTIDLVGRRKISQDLPYRSHSSPPSIPRPASRPKNQAGQATTESWAEYKARIGTWPDFSSDFAQITMDPKIQRLAPKPIVPGGQSSPSKRRNPPADPSSAVSQVATSMLTSIVHPDYFVHAHEERELGRDTITPPSLASGGVPEPTRAYLERARGGGPEPTPQPKPLLVVLDLNGTLLYRPSASSNPRSFVKRPFATEFLAYCISTFHVVVWSSARPSNVASMLEQLVGPELRRRIVAVWSRNRFGLTPQDYNARVMCYKRLSALWNCPDVAASYPAPPGRGGRWDQGNTVLVDDSPEKARSEPYNAITIPAFLGGGEPERRAVLPLVHDYLNTLACQVDVSRYMRMHPFRAEDVLDEFYTKSRQARAKPRRQTLEAQPC